jgi:hypothetical protein
LFNRQKQCMANGITVMSDKASDALCLTYIRD